MAHVELVSEASEESVGGSERTTEMQHPKGDDVHTTVTSSDSGTVRPAWEEAQTGTVWIPTPTPSSNKGKEKAMPMQPTQKTAKSPVVTALLLPNYLTDSHFAEFVQNFNHKWMEQTEQFARIKQHMTTEQCHSRAQCSRNNEPEETLVRDYPEMDSRKLMEYPPRGQTSLHQPETGTRGVHW